MLTAKLTVSPSVVVSIVPFLTEVLSATLQEPVFAPTQLTTSDLAVPVMDVAPLLAPLSWLTPVM
jgi:hypothetical protein